MVFLKIAFAVPQVVEVGIEFSTTPHPQADVLLDERTGLHVGYVDLALPSDAPYLQNKACCKDTTA